MPSPQCEKAINDGLQHGNAILKFISPNDVGITGSHQCGFYLPKSAWEMFTPHPPERGSLEKHRVSILWPDGRTTRSVVTWYGQRTRSEYRLTRFGREFPWLAADTVGDLLVLIPQNQQEFNAYVLDLEEDIEEIQTALGVEPFERWGVFRNGIPAVETEDHCLDRQFRDFVRDLADFPSGDRFSEATHRALQACVQQFDHLSADDVLTKCCESEYQLFRMAERQICQQDVARLFRDVDDFLQTASRILNRRKSRAGRSLENHCDNLLTRAGVAHQMRPSDIDGKPDIVIPSSRAYHDRSYPPDGLFIVGVKTTCKDRWRQVLNEAVRVRQKHILTIQQGISRNQLREMRTAGVTLIVPAGLHNKYPQRVMPILTVERFITHVRRHLP